VQDVAKSLGNHSVIGRHVLLSPEILPACSSGTVPYLGRGVGGKYLGMSFLVCVQGFDMIVCLQTGLCLGLTSGIVRLGPFWYCLRVGFQGCENNLKRGTHRIGALPRENSQFESSLNL
jgi:hypothetical protein